MSVTNSQFDLDTAIRGAFENKGFRIDEVPAARPHQKSFLVKDGANQKLLGVVNVDPHTTKTTSCSSNSKDDRTISVISLSMNLDQPVDGQQAKLNENELGMLFKLCGHAISQLAAKEHQDGDVLEHRFMDIPSQPKPSS